MAERRMFPAAVVELTNEPVYGGMTRLGCGTAVLYIKKLKVFILERNASIKDHYATILKWWEEDGGIFL